MNKIEFFESEIFQYILGQYGKSTVQKIKSDKNKSIVTKVVESACKQNDSIEHAANKVVAMLRIHP